MPERALRNRFGQTIDPGATLALQHGWRALTCTSCRATVAVFEVPAGYLNDAGMFGPYRCGTCQFSGERGV